MDKFELKEKQEARKRACKKNPAAFLRQEYKADRFWNVSNSSLNSVLKTPILIPDEEEAGIMRNMSRRVLSGAFLFPM